MGNLKLEFSHTNFSGESVYRLVYRDVNVIPTPLTTLEGMKKFRDDLTEAIKEKEHGKD